MFNDAYKNKRVFVTGHTGFKGSWLCAWLLELGARVGGYSMGIPTNPSMFEILGLQNNIRHYQGDLRDRASLLRAIEDFRPDIVIHMGAQALVRRSYHDPASTFEINILGTVNVLECIRQSPFIRAGVIITSDKCYREAEWEWGYRENDAGGRDPYSASKGCAELIVYSYVNSFFKEGARIASTRAGNVIGGGDWSEDRIVADAIRAWSQNKVVTLRNPASVRPWQHVMEPLSGYLWLGAKLLDKNSAEHGLAFNFGPDTYRNQTVGQLIKCMAAYWPGAGWKEEHTAETLEHEAALLKLYCDRALNVLSWKAILSFEETSEMTIKWYHTFYGEGKGMMSELTKSQINNYSLKAREKGLPWALS